MIWAGLALLVLGVIATHQEPRRIANGVLLLAGLSVLLVDNFGRTLRRLDAGGEMAAAWFLLGVLGVGWIFVAVLGVACVYNGVVMLRRERMSTAHLLSLALGLAMLLLVVATLRTVRGPDPFGAVLLLLAMPAVGYLAFLFSVFVLYSLLYSRLARTRLDAVAAVVVLGAGLAGAHVTPLLAGRLALGERIHRAVWESGRASRLVTSGGQGPGEAVPEAVAMRGWLLEHGVAADQILVEDRSTSTRQNLQFSSRLLAEEGLPGPVAVVSSDYHAMRAASLMRGLGLAGHAVGARTARYYWPSAMIREYVAWLSEHRVLHAVVVGLLLLPLLFFTGSALARLLGTIF